MKSGITAIGIAAALLLCLRFPVASQETIQVNYQGRLTNSTGTPLDGVYRLTFRLYDGTSQVWIETHLAVAVSDGLFAVLLGSVVPLYDTMFNAKAQYLGIQVGSDPELTPRTRLAALPAASFAYRVLGSVESGDGSLEVKSVNGDQAIEIVALSDSSSVDIGWSDPSSKALLRPGLRLRTGVSGARMNLFSQAPALLGQDALTFDADPFGNISMRMFDPQPEPPGKMFEVVATAGSGAAMNFFDQAGQVMGVEPSPFNNGFSIKMFDPQPEPPGKLFEITTSYGTRSSGSTFLMSAEVDAGYEDMVKMTADAAGGELRLGPGTDGSFGAAFISGQSGPSGSSLIISGPGGAVAPPTVALLANTTTPRIGIGTDAPSQALHVVGNICYTGTIGACSDEKFKTDIEPIDGALPLVEQLDGVRYTWRTDEYPDMQFSDDRQVGFVAQDVQQVLPEAVTTQEDGSLTVDYSRITPLLVQAIKELKSENEALKKRLEKLEKK